MFNWAKRSKCVKGYVILLFAKNIGKNLGNKYS